MSSNVYPKALTAFGRGQIDLLTANIKCALIDNADEIYNADDEFLSDITAAGIIAVSGALTSKTFGLLGPGIFDAADVVLPAVSGEPSESVLVFIDTGTPETSRVLALLDAFVVPNGNALTVEWDAAGIFQI